MQYVPFGNTGINVSRLGFGAMRLPTKEQHGKTSFDEDKGIELMRRAYELGVNYFDTAPTYCDSVSEIITGKAIQPFRQKIYLSTKNPIENASGDDYEKRLEQSLKKLNTDYIDFYHFWGISLDTFITKVCAPDGPMTRVKALKEQGVIKHISFSFHDKPENMLEIIKRGEGVFESLLCQYNMLDRSNEAGIRFAHKNGIGVVVMGPVGGGRLGSPSPAVSALLPGGKSQSTAAGALRFVFTNPYIHIALSGMGNLEMLEENVKTVDNTEPLSIEEQEHLDRAVKENERLAGLYCTGCKYCMPCPQGIDIPEIFTLMNYHRVYRITDYARDNYAQIGKPWRNYKNAAACVSCGICEEKCPQKLPIRLQLKETHAVLAS